MRRSLPVVVASLVASAAAAEPERWDTRIIDKRMADSCAMLTSDERSLDQTMDSGPCGRAILDFMWEHGANPLQVGDIADVARCGAGMVLHNRRGGETVEEILLRGFFDECLGAGVGLVAASPMVPAWPSTPLLQPQEPISLANVPLTDDFRASCNAFIGPQSTYELHKQGVLCSRGVIHYMLDMGIDVDAAPPDAIGCGGAMLLQVGNVGDGARGARPRRLRRCLHGEVTRSAAYFTFSRANSIRIESRAALAP